MTTTPEGDAAHTSAIVEKTVHTAAAIIRNPDLTKAIGRDPVSIIRREDPQDSAIRADLGELSLASVDGPDIPKNIGCKAIRASHRDLLKFVSRDPVKFCDRVNVVVADPDVVLKVDGDGAWALSRLDDFFDLALRADPDDFVGIAKSDPDILVNVDGGSGGIAIWEDRIQRNRPVFLTGFGGQLGDVVGDRVRDVDIRRADVAGWVFDQLDLALNFGPRDVFGIFCGSPVGCVCPLFLACPRRRQTSKKAKHQPHPSHSKVTPQGASLICHSSTPFCAMYAVSSLDAVRKSCVRRIK